MWGWRGGCETLRQLVCAESLGHTIRGEQGGQAREAGSDLATCPPPAPATAPCNPRRSLNRTPLPHAPSGISVCLDYWNMLVAMTFNTGEEGRWGGRGGMAGPGASPPAWHRGRGMCNVTSSRIPPSQHTAAHRSADRMLVPAVSVRIGPTRPSQIPTYSRPRLTGPPPPRLHPTPFPLSTGLFCAVVLGYVLGYFCFAHVPDAYAAWSNASAASGGSPQGHMGAAKGHGRGSSSDDQRASDDMLSTGGGGGAHAGAGAAGARAGSDRSQASTAVVDAGGVHVKVMTSEAEAGRAVQGSAPRSPMAVEHPVCCP